MKQEIKDRWIEKLESGEYDQATGFLTNGNGFCCLGVLCEVAVEDGIIQKSDPEHEQGYVAPLIMRDGSPYREGHMPETYIENSVLPTAVRIWAGLDESNPTVPYLTPGEIRRTEEDGDDPETWNMELSELNDGEHLNFREIAALIKEHL
jgi:hypothetical protein